MSLEFLLASPFLSVFDGEENEVLNPNPEPDQEQDLKPEGKGKQKVKLDAQTQAYVNSLLAEERRKSEKKNNELITQLETEKNRAGTTAAEKEALETRIETLKSEFATKDELKARETAKRVKDLETQNQQAVESAKTWESRYKRDRVRIDLTQAASAEKAYNPNQVVNELFSYSQLVEQLDDDGNPTGEFVTQVSLRDTGKDGQPTTLVLSPTAAVKHLKERDDFANLFISPTTGGLGGGNLGKGKTGGQKQPHEMNTEEYLAYKKKLRAASRAD